jgi:hypothetical protein
MPALPALSFLRRYYGVGILRVDLLIVNATPLAVMYNLDSLFKFGSAS